MWCFHDLDIAPDTAFCIYNLLLTFKNKQDRVNSFLNKEDVVVDVSTCNEPTLVGGDEVRDDRFKPGRKNFGKYFVGGIVEGYGVKNLNRGRFGFLGDKGEESGISEPANFSFGLDLGNKTDQVFFNYEPTFPIETDRETI